MTGWLVPDINYSTRKGLEIAAPYRWQIGPNRDLTVTPHLYTGVLPAIEAKYRELNRIGAFQLGGFLTYGTIESADPNATDGEEGRDFRGYVEGNGKFQLNPLWSITGSFRVASDKTVTQPLRHQPRRPAAQLCQRRADQPQQLHHDRRLGVPGPARRRRSEDNPDRLARD